MRRTLLAVPLAALILLAGCSISSKAQVATAATGGTPASSSAPATDPGARLRQYTTCLRQHGLHVDDPTPGQAGVTLDPKDDPNTTASAVQACMVYAAAGDAPTPPTTAELDKLRGYARCMRDHGVSNFPDPDPRTGFFTGLTKSSYDPADPTVKAALDACQSLAPATQPGG